MAVETKTRTRGKRAKRSDAKRKTRYRRHGTALPEWSDLSGGRSSDGARASLLRHVSTGQFALLIAGAALAVTLYIGHVQATQDVLVRLRQAQQENQRLHMRLTRLQGEFDRATGPSIIYERAHKLGLEESVVYGPTIYVDKKDNE